MKKLVLSLGVFVVFIAYTLMSRNQPSGLVIGPKSGGGQTASTTSGQSSGGSSAGTTSGSASTGNGNGPTAPSSSSPTYKDGTYAGSEADAFYGLVKVAATISGGKMTAVNFLEHPSDNPNSVYINQQAMPYLQQEAIQAQSANVNIISGATDTSQAFIQSLSAALSHAM
jgi:uncharacterized protein with FMN-binding domain